MNRRKGTEMVGRGLKNKIKKRWVRGKVERKRGDERERSWWGKQTEV